MKGFYTVVSSWKQGDKHARWANNNLDCGIKARSTFIITIEPFGLPEFEFGNWIVLGAAGYGDQEKKGPGPAQLRQWSLEFMLACQLAAANGTDLLYKAQDCLCFGAVVPKMYEILATAHKGKGIVCDKMLERGLILVAYESTLAYVSAFLAIKDSDNVSSPEHKWKRLIESGFPITLMDTGYGSSRPMPIEEMQRPFFLQNVTLAEVATLDKLGHIL